MLTSEEYSPFLNFNPTDPITIDSVTHVFISLVSMVRDGYHFNPELLKQASTFFSSLRETFSNSDGLDAFLKAIGQVFPDPAAVIISTPHLRNLSAIENQSILNDIITIFRSGVWLSTADDIQSTSVTSSTNPQSIRSVVLNEVLIPMEPSLVQISRNPHLLSWSGEFKVTLNLLVDIFDVSVFHQPTLDFICSSHIPMSFQSLLSKVELQSTDQIVIWKMNDIINRLKEGGVENAGRGRIVLQTLEQEGFRAHLEQRLLHNQLQTNGNPVRIFSYQLMNNLGMNCRLPQ
ncbi:hypothetical protein BLNAU_3190 [Blattamonas nauphoetae]|uniref:Uncharacterized protein n=1 Tax=Blattamonas nauphoetae TaxID=2049346 RepID=A0ABQ9YDB4_9EUKA|nr:hypothetical protein BLNAU_3190 [Blattamonas nauphoetae]